MTKKPTIGFINPPFGGKHNKTNPTQKEIQFLEKLLDNCNRYVIIIAPLSTYFTEDTIRTRILTKHRLKYVINMPSDAFQPNAVAHTAIAVFETNIPQTQEDKVVFYSLKDDGFRLSKNKGRTDPFNHWGLIQKNLFETIQNPIQNEDQVNLVYKSLIDKDEWILQAHSKMDSSQLREEDFIKTIREYIVFQIKKDLNLLNKKIDELEIFEILKQNQIQTKSVIELEKNPLEINKLNSNLIWKEFKINDLFNIKRGELLVKIDEILGYIPFITVSFYNNGIKSFIFFDLFENRKKLFQNRITIDTFGTVFYHSYNYFSNDSIHTLLLKSENELSIYTNLFLVSILRKLQIKYSFGRQVTLQRLGKEIFQLPSQKITTTKLKAIYEPDWLFMDAYIKSLPYSSNL